MTKKFKNKYRIQSNRLRGWDYAGNGYYFITIVTAGRKSLFGNIVNGKMILNDLGQIVYDEFFKSFELRKELFLGEFVLMPNHLHAIVILDKTKCTDIDTRGHTETNDIVDIVETHGRAFLQYRQQYHQSPAPTQFQRRPQSISSFVAGFKSSTIKQIDDWIDSNNLPMAKFNKNNPLWQSNYHDHIIRNKTEYQRISDYITRNPLKWEENILK